VVLIRNVGGWQAHWWCSCFTDAVLKVLYKHITEGHEFQVRFRWTKNAVAVWDNRITAHFATFDYLPGNRHAVRVTTQGEIPYAGDTKP